MALGGHNITIAGCGPGALELISPAARESIEEAEILVGTTAQLALFPHVEATRIPFQSDVDALLDQLAKCRRRRVTVMVSGDPGVSSLAQPIIRRFGREACRVIAGISSVQVAFARVALDWSDARIISAHASDPDLDPAPFRQVGKIAVLGGRAQSMRWIARFASSLGGDRIAVVCEDLTLGTERIRQMGTTELAGLETAPKTIVLVLKRELLT